MDAASSFLCRSIRIPSTAFTFTRPPVSYVCLVSDKRDGVRVSPTRKVFCSGGSSATKRKPRRKSNVSDKLRPRKVEKRKDTESVSVSSETCVVEEPKEKGKELSLRALNQNGDPLGRRDLGRNVVKWISQAMKAMASDLANAEVQGEFWELRQNAGSGLTFVIQAQPYLNAIPMPLGLEVICMKACTHYPTLFDHFQRELRDVLQDLESKNVLENWKETQSWKLLKEIANSAQHREVARKAHQPKPVAGVFGMDSEKVKAIQARIDEFTSRMSQLLQVERDTELEVTQEELDVIPTPDESSDSSKPIEFLVRHGEAPQELCDTICNLYAVSTSTGLGGMHLVLFKVGGNHRLPPTTLSPGDMVCIRICDSKGAGATSCTQGFVHNLGDDGCSIGVALESRHGDPTFSKLFGKSVRIDRIHGLADALTYERNCEALMLLQKNGLQKKNPSISVVATLFGDGEDITWLEQNDYVDWSEAELSDEPVGKLFDDSQRRAIALGVNKKRPVMIVQGPPGTGKTGLLKEVITLAVQQGERVLVTAPTNAAVDNMVEKLSHLGLNIVRVGNPARISSAVASKSLGEIVNSKLASFRAELERKKSDLRKDLRQCLRDDSLAAGIRQLLKQLGKALKKKEKETVKEILSNAQVVFATNIGAADPLIRRLETFDLVVIDEAGQSIEPSCWIPILQGKRCILAGDPCQLAPVVLSRKALEDGLGVSLLERAASLHDGLLSTKLTTQYRMNDVIAGWASKEMYGGWLKSAPSVASHLLIDSPFVKPTWITQCPLLLLDTRMPYGSLSMGCEERLDPAGTGSLYNEGEADIVVNHVISLIYAGVSPMAIAVQSPYVAQVQLLRERLDDFPVADGVEVATIDSFQGREADAVIISMTVASHTLFRKSETCGPSYKYVDLMPTTASPNRPLHPRRSRVCYVFLVILTLIFIIAVGFLITWLVTKPKKLHYSLENASVQNFNLTDDNHMSATFKLTIQSHNPNHRISVYYNSVEIYVKFKDQTLAFDTMEPFHQPRMNVTQIDDTLVAQNVAVSKSSESRPFYIHPEKLSDVSAKIRHQCQALGWIQSQRPYLSFLGEEASIESDLYVGFFQDNGPRLKALLVYIEHRYYGKSVPFGSAEEALKNASTLGYLNGAQALAMPRFSCTLRRNILRNIAQLSSSGDPIWWNPLSRSFDIKDFLDSIYAESVQFNGNPGDWVATLCNAIDNPTNRKNYVLDRIFAGVVAYFGNQSCYDTDLVIQPSNNAIAWSWQACKLWGCSEIVMPIGHDKHDTMFQTAPFNMTSFIDDCKSKYGVSPRPHWITTYFGIQDIKLILRRFGSNVIFSNGLADPYSVGGVLENVSGTVVALKTLNGTHCKTSARGEKTILNGW